MQNVQNAPGGCVGVGILIVENQMIWGYNMEESGKSTLALSLLITMEIEDKELIEKSRAGDKEAFNRLVIKYQVWVFNLSYRMLGDYQEANDISQEAFIKLYFSLKEFRGDASLSTYLYRIVANLCKNRIRGLMRRRKVEVTSLDASLETDDGELRSGPISSSPSPREELDRKNKQVLIQKAINSLAYEFREAIVLRDIQQLSYQEICEVLGIEMGTVKSRVHRAREFLKEKLKGVI